MARADVLLLVSDNKPSFMMIAEAVRSKYSGQSEIVSLQGNANLTAERLPGLQKHPADLVVAMGLLAAQTARLHLDDKHIVFCQVLNYEQFDLVTPWMKGVSALPSLDKQFAFWKKLNPTLQRVMVFTGGHMGYVVTEATKAARDHGIELSHREISTSRELKMAFDQVADSVQGLWLAPDSSILSTQVISDVMMRALKAQIQVLAFSPALLKEGALLSATADENEIINAVLARIREFEVDGAFRKTNVVDLMNAKMQLNERAVQQFNLIVPPHLKEPQ